MTIEPLPCVDVVELLTDYLEGALDPATSARIDAHLAQCPPCVTYLEQLRTTVNDLGSLPAQTLSDSAIAELEAAFGDFHRPPAS